MIPVLNQRETKHAERHSFLKDSVHIKQVKIMDEKEEERRQTPIVDGDARPDMPIAPDLNENKAKKGSRSSKNKKFEAERLSDINSLEDYKDAK